jgi:hypothetical protein
MQALRKWWRATKRPFGIPVTPGPRYRDKEDRYRRLAQDFIVVAFP